MRLHTLIAELSEVRVLQAGDPDVTGLATDSRKVRPGDVFVAIRGGEEEDRHAFVQGAVEAGAVGLVVEEPVGIDGVATVRVPSTRRALSVMAERFYDHPCASLRMVGVTGTNGKTSTVYLIRAILEGAGWRPGLISTVEYNTGKGSEPSSNSTPEAHELQRMFREMVGRECRSAVMEATSHGLVLDRVYGIGFETAVFTNLTRDHLDFHGTEQSYLAAKALLFDNLDRNAFAVVNGDDPATEALLARCQARVIRFGISEAMDVRILEGRSDWQGTQMRLSTPRGSMSMKLSLQGSFQQWNVAASVGAGLAMGVAPEAIVEAIRDVQVPGRFERVDRGQDFGVVVDYAHTPDGLENVLKAARPLTEGRLICVFGCGGDRDPGKRPEMGRISEELADFTVVTSDNPRTEDPEAIVRDILPGVAGSEHRAEVDRREAIEMAVGMAERGDLVVIAGKGHEDYQIFATETIHFDDREVAAEALEARMG